MKTFIHHDIPEIVQHNSPSGRTYATPNGNKYPSVTAITSLHAADAIKSWQERVGIAEANRIRSKASKRGSSIHNLCEGYLLNGEANVPLVDHEVFVSMQQHLDRIDNIHCLETQLFSHHLEVAGTTDCIAEYDGQLCVIDFKTSSRPKKEEWVEGYFMQTAAYAVMFEELVGKPITHLKIIIGVDDHGAQVFDAHRDQWIDQFIKYREQYRSTKGI